MANSVLINNKLVTVGGKKLIIINPYNGEVEKKIISSDPYRSNHC